MSTSVFRNLTTFWVENKMAKYLRMQYRHWTLCCHRCHQYITPLLEDHSLHLMVKEDPWGRGVRWNWFLFKYSAFWVEGHAGKHWWWVAAVCKISYNFYVLTIALKKFEKYMKCCLLSNVQVSQNSFSRVYCNSENEVLFPFEIKLPSVPDHEPINPLQSLSSVCIFSILFSKHFLPSWQREFGKQSRAFLVGDHFLYFCDLNVCHSGGGGGVILQREIRC